MELISGVLERAKKEDAAKDSGQKEEEEGRSGEIASQAESTQLARNDSGIASQARNDNEAEALASLRNISNKINELGGL